MRIAVIGATGHIGTWLIPRLVRAGHDVIALSRGSRRPYHDSSEWNRVESVVIDRTAEEGENTFGDRIAKLDADVVVDLICFDIASALQIVNALRNRVQHFIHCGTLWVHGIPRTRPYDETAVREPFGDYGIHKAEIESFLLRVSREGFPATILHPGHITGPGWIPINPAGNLDFGVFERLAEEETVALPDDGTATLQHVHADDVAHAFELAIAERESSIGEAFHIAAAEPVTMLGYAREVAAWSDREAKIELLAWEEWRLTVSERDAELTRDHMLHSPCASIAKAEKLLGFRPRYTAVEAVRDALDERRRK
jgi:nucleoside-diphosphate-sugar epimerase